jgi:hypothetical protein
MARGRRFDEALGRRAVVPFFRDRRAGTLRVNRDRGAGDPRPCTRS